MRACALAVLLCLAPVAATRVEEAQDVVLSDDSASIDSLAKHAHSLLLRFAKNQVNMSVSDVTKVLHKDKVLTSTLQEHMRAEESGETKNKFTRNDLRNKLLERSSSALHKRGESLDESTGGKTQCMCAIQHYQGYEMVDFETKFDYTQGFMGDYQNGKIACANAKKSMTATNDCIYRCHSDMKYGMDWQEGAKLGVDQQLPYGMLYTASRCNMDGRCECVDVSETVRKVNLHFGGHANLISDHPTTPSYDTPEQCLYGCDCADGGGVDQEGICIDEFNQGWYQQARQYQFQTAPQYSFDQ